MISNSTEKQAIENHLFMGLLICLFSFKVGNDVILRWVEIQKCRTPRGSPAVSEQVPHPSPLTPAVLSACSGPYVKHVTLASSLALALKAQQDTIRFLLYMVENTHWFELL